MRHCTRLGHLRWAIMPRILIDFGWCWCFFRYLVILGFFNRAIIDMCQEKGASTDLVLKAKSIRWGKGITCYGRPLEIAFWLGAHTGVSRTTSSMLSKDRADTYDCCVEWRCRMALKKTCGLAVEKIVSLNSLKRMKIMLYLIRLIVSCFFVIIYIIESYTFDVRHVYQYLTIIYNIILC